MVWPSVARQYVSSFEQAHRENEKLRRSFFSSNPRARRPVDLPALNLNHLAFSDLAAYARLHLTTDLHTTIAYHRLRLTTTGAPAQNLEQLIEFDEGMTIKAELFFIHEFQYLYRCHRTDGQLFMFSKR